MMIKIEVYGMGCRNCHQLEANVKQAIAKSSITAEVEMVTDPVKIAEAGIMMTPALAINGDVVTMGRVTSVQEILELLAEVR
ncbi:MAG: thioredoxin family protein [Methanoregulaceae archaeon]|nr:thioredoxin family protein [Methanoregulaceae archaeon]